jgi:ribosomal-protein-serine acetyltransferase
MPVPRKPLFTDRLTLEPTGPEHTERIWEAVSSSLPELRPWLIWAVKADGAAENAFSSQAPILWEAGSDYAFAILNDDAIIGGVGLHHRASLLPIVEIGYWLRSDRTRRGYTTEAASAAVDFAFEILEVDRIELRAGVGNTPSQRVASKLGFAREGLLRHGGLGESGPYDSYLYGLLRSDKRPGG